MLPQNFQIPVACSNTEQAQTKFSTCTNRIRCNCGNSPHNCQCPDHAILNLRDKKEYTLPLTTPFTKLSANSHSITATSDEEEIVIRIESRFLQASNELVINQNCELQTTELTGCYDCELGAHLTATCRSSTQVTVTVTCESQQFLVKCGPSGERSNVILSFHSPHVHELCSAHCSEHPTNFLLNGTLYYHVEPPHSSMFEVKSHGVALRHQWFADITMPNIDPLIGTIQNHWKVALGALTSVIAISAVTYLAGPVILLTIAKLALCAVTTALHILWKLLSYCMYCALYLCKVRVRTKGNPI